MRPTRAQIEQDTLDLIKQLSEKPIEPRLTHQVVGELGFDSMRVMELLGNLEEHFDVTVPLNNLSGIRTVGQVVDYVEVLLEKKAEGRG